MQQSCRAPNAASRGCASIGARPKLARARLHGVVRCGGPGWLDRNRREPRHRPFGRRGARWQPVRRRSVPPRQPTTLFSTMLSPCRASSAGAGSFEGLAAGQVWGRRLSQGWQPASQPVQRTAVSVGFAPRCAPDLVAHVAQNSSSPSNRTLLALLSRGWLAAWRPRNGAISAAAAASPLPPPPAAAAGPGRPPAGAEAEGAGAAQPGLPATG